MPWYTWTELVSWTLINETCESRSMNIYPWLSISWYWIVRMVRKVFSIAAKCLDGYYYFEARYLIQNFLCLFEAALDLVSLSRWYLSWRIGLNEGKMCEAFITFWNGKFVQQHSDNCFSRTCKYSPAYVFLQYLVSDW